jgi:hypothetical protein
MTEKVSAMQERWAGKTPSPDASAPELALKLTRIRRPGIASESLGSVQSLTPRNEKILGSLPSAASCAPPVHVTCSYSFEPSRNTEDRTTTVYSLRGGRLPRRLMACFMAQAISDIPLDQDYLQQEIPTKADSWLRKARPS